MRDIVDRALRVFLLGAVVCNGAFAQTRPRQVHTPPVNTSSDPARRTEVEEKTSEAVTPANKGDEVLRIDTTLVLVPLSVHDRNGRSLVDLQQDDFHIYEDGVEQTVAYFATVEKPFTVVLMLDTSASTWSKLGLIKDAAKIFVEQLRAEDQVMVISFGMGLKVQCEPTSDRQKIRKAIAGTGRGLSTHLYDAMQKVMRKYLDRIQGRKAVVLFTDGVDATSNDATYESSVRTAEEVDALIYSIRYDTYDPANDHGGPSHRPLRLPSIFRKIPLPLPTIGGGAGSTRADYDQGERYLQQLAELTGGQVYEASKDLRYLQDAFSEIAAELSRQYSVGYYPTKKGVTGERRQIRVRVDRPAVAVRARAGYVYKEKSATAAKKDKAGNTAKPADDKSDDRKVPVLQKQPFAATATAHR
jgi:VWFA-related protein